MPYDRFKTIKDLYGLSLNYINTTFSLWRSMFVDSLTILYFIPSGIFPILVLNVPEVGRVVVGLLVDHLRRHVERRALDGGQDVGVDGLQSFIY